MKRLGCPNDRTHTHFACSEGCSHSQEEHNFKEGDLVDCLDCEKEGRNGIWETTVNLVLYEENPETRREGEKKLNLCEEQVLLSLVLPRSCGTVFW